MANITNKTFGANRKDINYLNRDFLSLKNQLIEFTKQYYPQDYKDFSDSSPGMIFIEQAAYVGDILSYYTDQQFQESFIQFSTERKNIINLARTLGYKPHVTAASSTTIEISQFIPAEKYVYLDDNGFEHIDYRPNPNFYVSLKPYTSLSSTSGVNFLIEDSINFEQDTIFSPRKIIVYSRDQNTNAPTQYLVTKTTTAFSGKLVQKTFTIGELTSFLTLDLPETNVIKIIDVVDTNGNTYYEVDSLAQETIPISIDNISINNETLSQYQAETPKLLKYIKTENRFITYIDENNITHLQFGANYENFENDVIIPNPTNVGSCLRNLNKYNISLDGTNVLKCNSYGVSPSNTTLTVTYAVGGGIESNINSNEITTINSIGYYNDINNLSGTQQVTFKNIINNILVNNINPATGGANAESNEMIRQNAIANFSSQNRIVTSSDILLRVYSMANEFGSIAKAYVEQNSAREISYNGLIQGIIDDSNSEYIDISSLNPLDRRKFLSSTHPFTNNIYLLGYDLNKHLVKCNEATLYNLKTYLDQYKILTDKFNFIDGYIINIGVNFKISIFSGYNKRIILNECINTIKEFFNIDNWGFCQPINLSQLQFNIMNVEGVQSVSEIEIKNLTSDNGDEYSNIAYNISVATKNNIIYPSKDPSVFELKFPDIDIVGSVI